jgi:hypothetical protein
MKFWLRFGAYCSLFRLFKKTPEYPKTTKKPTKFEANPHTKNPLIFKKSQRKKKINFIFNDIIYILHNDNKLMY